MANGPALDFWGLTYLRPKSQSGRLKCDRLLAVAVYSMAERRAVIGVDRDFVARAADRDVKLLSINGFNGTKCIDIHDDVIDRRPLARM